jgi:hypothetical protein
VNLCSSGLFLLAVHFDIFELSFLRVLANDFEFWFYMQVLCNGKELATDETTNRMINVLKRFQQTLPPDFLASTFSTLQPQQQLMLQSILST